MERKVHLFWPLFLIAAGVVWLLVQSGTIPSENLWALTYIWPFLLIAAGIGLILRPYWRYAPALLDVLVIGGAVLAILYAPQFGWASPSQFAWVNFGDSFVGPGERGSGHVISETREVSGFDSVSVEYPGQVVIKQGNTESIKVEAEDNLLPHLKTQVRGGTLEIFYRREGGRHVNATKPVKITITVKDLNDVNFSSAGELTIEKLETESLDVSLSGAGNINIEDIQASDLSVHLSGAGSMSASGAAENLDVNISGFGDFKGGNLHDKAAHVNISGAGSATVWVDDDLTAGVSGAGSVNYYGSPAVTKQVSGVGNIRHLGDK